MEGWLGVSSLRLTGLDSGHMGLIPPSRGDHSVRIWGAAHTWPSSPHLQSSLSDSRSPGLQAAFWTWAAPTQLQAKSPRVPF